MKRNKIIIAISLLVLIVILIVGVYNAVKFKGFFRITFPQLSASFIALFFAFIATQHINDERNYKQKAVQVIEKLQNTVGNESFYAFSSEENYKKQITITNRKISNYLSIMSKYSERLKFNREIDYINGEFEEYKEFVSEHICDFDYLLKSEMNLRRLSENIDSKCDEIIQLLFM